VDSNADERLKAAGTGSEPADPEGTLELSPETVAQTGRIAATLVAAGILLSRMAGLIREGVFAHFFGTTIYAEAFKAGLRMPNVLQNLLGEGTLSASFIPVYSELLEQGREEDAGRVAGAIFALLFAVAGVLALIGVLFAPAMVSIFLPGFEGERRELTITVTRILFPMTGVLVLSAWSLGILNSHRRFFVPYFAPVVWNAAMIGTLLLFGGALPPDRLVVALAWGALLGGALQFLIQLPWVLRLERQLKIGWGHRLAEVRETVRNAGPAILGRGVVQLSGWLDMILASFLAAGAVAAITYAQVLYMLPVSLFGMSVAAAELPELSRARGGATEELRVRTTAALERVAFFVIPSVVAFLLIGDVLIAALYQRGEFVRADTLLVYATLAAYSIGLLASTMTRLFSSTFFALRDTVTPARFAAVRVVTAGVLGATFMVQFEPIMPFGADFVIGGGTRLADLDIDGRSLGAAGLALGTGLAAWLEWALLRRRLKQRIGSVNPGWGVLLRMVGAALAAAAAAWGMRWVLPEFTTILRGAFIAGTFGIVYLGLAAALGLSEARVFASRLLRRVRR
jgi:putative peptidoglycan lipid II flippase